MASVSRPRVDAIDVSHYQHVTDEAAIPHLPVMTCKGSEGAKFKDPTRPEWLRIFRSRAQVLGMYHWIRSDSPMDVQVQNIAECYRQEGVLPAPGQLAPGWVVQLDWERTKGLRDMTVAEVELWHHYADIEFGPGRVITYSSDWVPGFPAWRARNRNKPVWYANFSLTDLPSGGEQESARYDACLWQWSSQVMVPGIDTISRPGIDVSVLLKWAQVLQAAHLEVSPIPVPDPIPGDEMPQNYYVVKGANAKFIGLPPMVHWTGPGDDKLVDAIQKNIANGTLIVQDVTGGPMAFALHILEGDLPTGDTLYNWTGDEFANSAQIKARKPATTVDQVARDAAAHANDGVDNINKRIVEASELGSRAWDALG